MSGPDRLYIDTNVRSLIKDELENINFLNIKDTKNKELFLYAVALGINAPTEIKGTKDGLLLDKDLGPIEEALIYACIMPSLDEIENISSKAMRYDYVQKCANTGFQIIQGIINEGSIENIDKRLLAELDEKYEELLSEYNDLKS